MERLNLVLASFLCWSLSFSGIPADAQSPSPGSVSPAAKVDPKTSPNMDPRKPYVSNQLHGDDRILHALNRFTFGPRPEDLEAVRAMGLEQWFDRQLHPASLDQSDLNLRLAQFPAMRAPTQELLLRFPSNAVINQTMDGKLPLPPQAGLHTVYEAQIFRVQARKQEQARKRTEEQAKLASNSAETGNANGDAVKVGLLQGLAGNRMSGAEAGQMGSNQISSQEPDAGAMSMSTSMSAAAMGPMDDSAIKLVLGLAPQQRVQRVYAMKPDELERFFQALKGPQRGALIAGLSPAMKEQVLALENPQRLVTDELVGERLTRDIYSSAQLQEVMTDFWLNHFNVFLHKSEETPYYLVSYERDAIRPRALGRFEDLLEATAHSPAMLLYLDNVNSMGPDSPAAERAKLAAEKHPDSKKKAPEGLNENYARELMELHTLSVNGGYTQKDVTQVARVFTGWTVDRPQLGGGFKFDANRHEPGTKKVLGMKIKENGELEGRELLHFLATRPATAQFLARKLAVRFVSDDPPQSLVDRMAKSYLSSGGDIAVVMKTLFHSPEFWTTHMYRAKVKTPLEFVVSAVRSSNAIVSDPLPLANAMRDMGMPVYGSMPPTGYNWQASTWISTGALVNRMNFAMNLTANRLPGTAVLWTPLPTSVPLNTTTVASSTGTALGKEDGSSLPSAESEEARLESLLIVGGVSISTRSATLQQVAPTPQQAIASAQPVAVRKPVSRSQQTAILNREDEQIAGLLLGSPEFQRR